MINAKLWSRNFTLLTLSNFLLCCAYYFLISTLPIFIADVLKTNQGIVGLVMVSYAIASIIIRPFYGFGLDYLSRKIIFIGSLLVYRLIFNVSIRIA